jgi:hypothetical protein
MKRWSPMSHDMTHRTHALLVAAALLGVLGCGGSGAAERSGPGTQNSNTEIATVGQDFSLKPGQSIRLGGTRSTITLIGIPEDSRCPVEVQCIWAGNARLDLRLDGTPFSLNTTVEPHEAVVQGFRFQLVALTQRPQGDTVSANYSATLRVTK